MWNQFLYIFFLFCVCSIPSSQIECYRGVSNRQNHLFFLLYDTRLKWHQRQNQIIMDIIWIYKNVRKFFFFILFGLLIYKHKSEPICRRPAMRALWFIYIFLIVLKRFDWQNNTFVYTILNMENNKDYRINLFWERRTKRSSI